MTIIDYRTEDFLETDRPIPSIKTKCRIIKCLLDDFSNPAIRNLIPKDGEVVLVCETGNRDKTAMKYLFKFGYLNIKGLKFGMRGWIKLDYPMGTWID